MPTTETTVSFIQSTKLIQQECHDNAVAKGFWEHLKGLKTETVVAEKLMLIVSEASEALEGVRKDGVLKSNLGEELADICIRVFDLAGHFEIDLGNEIIVKMGVNSSRPWKHGKEI